MSNGNTKANAMVNHVNVNTQIMRETQLSEQASGRNVHDHLKNLDIPDLQALTQNSSLDFWVMCLNLTGELNISVIVRTSHLLGAERVVVFGRRSYDRRGLVGAANYTPVDRVWGCRENSCEIDSELFREFCVNNSVTPVMIEQGGESCFTFDWADAKKQARFKGQKLMLVVGTEGSGIPNDVISVGRELGHIVSIPQRGVLRSYNVSSAFAIVGSQMCSALDWLGAC